MQYFTRYELLSSLIFVTDRQTDGQTDGKRRIRAHRAIRTGGLKNGWMLHFHYELLTPLCGAKVGSRFLGGQFLFVIVTKVYHYMTLLVTSSQETQFLLSETIGASVSINCSRHHIVQRVPAVLTH